MDQLARFGEVLVGLEVVSFGLLDLTGFGVGDLESKILDETGDELILECKDAVHRAIELDRVQSSTLGDVEEVGGDANGAVGFLEATPADPANTQLATDIEEPIVIELGSSCSG